MSALRRFVARLRVQFPSLEVRHEPYRSEEDPLVRAFVSLLGVEAEAIRGTKRRAREIAAEVYGDAPIDFRLVAVTPEHAAKHYGFRPRVVMDLSPRTAGRLEAAIEAVVSRDASPAVSIYEVWHDLVFPLEWPGRSSSIYTLVHQTAPPSGYAEEARLFSRGHPLSATVHYRSHVRNVVVQAREASPTPDPLLLAADNYSLAA